ncbi:helix-turn-helix domain-containing protein [Streptomyces sp. NPDC086835]|uniref:helix-turn-helix domain-containing protein n=1 Tax=Streptomyces sp. NPDC086835 TaxID=3365761 RepID=UPI00380DD6B3
MPRWKELPEGLDPEVREFTGQLRGLVDRSGLSIAAVSDRTGYSKTSWERYLNGRLLAPKGAAVALAEVTGTDTGHVTTMWELAERAWSRAEARHDMTMEAIRISQAREALGGVGGQGPTMPSAARPGGAGRAAGPRDAAGRVPAGGYGPGPHGRTGGPAADPYGGPAVADPYGGPGGAGAYGDPARPGGYGGPAAPGGGDGRPARRARKGPFVVAAVVSVLIVGAGGWFLVNGDGGDGREDRATRSPSAAPTTTAPELPAGVKCNGADCAGQDPEIMGCGGEYAKTVSTATVGTAVIEVRHSRVCGAAWARITKAAVGDSVQIAVGGKTAQSALVNADKDAYTPMAAAPDPADAKACATLTTGTKGCTTAP